jgi:excinuclease ABC subunit C
VAFRLRFSYNLDQLSAALLIHSVGHGPSASKGFDVKSLFGADVFAGFGPTLLHPTEYQPACFQVCGSRASQLRAGVREQADRQPGVYGMLDARGTLIYVGKAKCLRNRLLSYFRVKSRDRKAGRILRHARSIVCESAPNEFGALVRELELIRRHRPRFNVQGQPGYRRYHYICLGRAPAAYAYVTRQPTGKETAWYGPVLSPARAGDAVRRLNDWFRLRDCPQSQRMVFSDQGELFTIDRTPGCLRYEIGTCLGPCAGFCSRAEYAAKLRAARSFLEGKDLRPLATLQSAMQEASARFEYEKASAIRDRLQDLQWLADRLNWLRQSRDQHSYIYPVTGTPGRTIWYLIHRGQVRGVVFEPTDSTERRRTAKLIDSIFKRNSPLGNAPVSEGQADTVLLVSAWFRKYPAERTVLLTQEGALRWCNSRARSMGK